MPQAAVAAAAQSAVAAAPQPANMDHFRVVPVGGLCGWSGHSVALKYARDWGESNSATCKDYSFDTVEKIPVIKKPKEGGPNQMLTRNRNISVGLLNG